MDQDIIEITKNLKSGKYPTEAMISQFVVKRILSLLHWPLFNEEMIIPEYSLKGKRVDLALCNNPNKPIIFIEIKQLGLCSRADKQLFEYAFEVGIPVAILTDGREWYFYLPGEQGNYEERCVFCLDLYKTEIPVIIERFSRYLSFDLVKSGVALENAKNDYRELLKAREIRTTFPKAWELLLNDPDDKIFDSLSNKIAQLCGYRPTIEEVRWLLKENIKLIEKTPVIVPPPPHPILVGNFTYIFKGKTKSCRNGRELVKNVLIDIYYEDNMVFEKFSRRPLKEGARPHIGRSKEELYPTSPHLVTEAIQLINGWWADGNLSKAGQVLLIQTVCGFTKIKYGSDLVVNIGN